MPLPTRKIAKWACDGCKLRKIKCSSVSPCPGCVAAGIACTFNKRPLMRGPRNLRAKTIRRITETQQQHQEDEEEEQAAYGWGDSVRSPRERGIGQTLPATTPPAIDHHHHHESTPPGATTPSATTTTSYTSNEPSRTSTSSLVLRLCVYRLRLFPVWPIVDVEEIMGCLHRDPRDMGTYALANAIGAATIAQLKLDSTDNGDMETAASMEAECQRGIGLLRKDGQDATMSINSLRVSFFLHVYHENRSPGGSRSLLYLREAITIAQIMGLHLETTYSSLTTREQRMRQRILSLLFVTERGVAMLHKLPVILRYNALFLNLDDTDDETHILPAFKKLVSLFVMFDQSGAFDILHTSDEIQFPPYGDMHSLNRNSLSSLQQQLREASIHSRQSNDVQTADICVTTQWMQAILWRASMSCRSNLDSSQQQTTSLSHPIQIAKEFLETMSQIPRSAMEAHGPAMEYKIYEIAKAVTDSVMTEFNGQSISLDISREILLRLRSKLASCRGGNKVLLPMLHARISEALFRPSLRFQELTDHEQLSSGETIFYSNPQTQILPLSSVPNSSPPRSTGVYQEQANPDRPGLSQDSNEISLVLQGVSCDQNIPDTLPFSSHDLFNQAQMFQESFDNIESAGTMELLFANSGLWDSVESWGSQFADAVVE